MKNISVIIGLTILSSIALSQNIETLWKARGLEAEEKIEIFKKNKKPSKKESCEIVIEKAFTYFSDKKLSKLVIVKQPKNIQFTLLLRNEVESELTIVFQYLPDSKSPELIMPMFIKGMSKTEPSWGMLLVPDNSGGTFHLTKQNCFYTFTKEDYLHPNIESR